MYLRFMSTEFVSQSHFSILTKEEICTPSIHYIYAKQIGNLSHLPFGSDSGTERNVIPST